MILARLRRRLYNAPLTLGALAVAMAIALPILAIAAAWFGPPSPYWGHLSKTVLPTYATNTLQLGALTGLCAMVIGVGAAWLVTMCRFPWRRFFEWALVLPLAFPAYVLAYAYTDLLDHPGPVQTALRVAFGWGPRDYWFPEIRSLGGAAAMLTLVLYPYVYLLARAAFLQQSVAGFEVARTLGHGPWGGFFRVSLPMARPAIATGVALVLMETLADFGVVKHFGVPTFATGVYRAWSSMGDRAAAAQISAVLLMVMLALVALEKTQRSAARYHPAGRAFHALPQFALAGWRRWLATAACGLPVLFGFVLPLATLGWMSMTGGHALFGPRYLGFALNSLTLAAITAAVAVGLAVFLAYAARLTRNPLNRVANTIASMGYAAPGTVIGVGMLGLLAGLRDWTGLVLIGGLGALIFAYLTRFMSVAIQTAEASLAKVTPSMDHAARTLGEGPAGALRRIHAPLIRGGLLTAGLIVFVDVMKELPATLILRPFNFDTLAVQAYRLASDERLTQASTPSLAIVAVGLIPVLLLNRQIRRSRPIDDI